MPITNMTNAFSLEGKNAVVTGGTKGIGFGIATAFAQQGANVIMLGRDEKAGEKAVAELSAANPGKFAFYRCDMGDTAACKATTEKIIADWGEINILVNNAGVGTNGNFLDMDDEMSNYFHCVDVDLNGVARMSFFVAKHMKELGKGGKIINISSNAGDMASRAIGMSAYCTAKAGVNQFTRAVGMELAPYGINMNAIAPGYTYSNLFNGMPDEALDGIRKTIPTLRMGTPIEIGALAVYLASPAADQVVGTIVTIDGGHSLGIY